MMRMPGRMMLMKPETRLRDMDITLECRECGETAIVDMKEPGAKEAYNAFFEKHPNFCGGGEREILQKRAEQSPAPTSDTLTITYAGNVLRETRHLPQEGGLGG